MAVAPDPVLPDFDGGNLSAVLPALRAAMAGAETPEWLPTIVAGADQVVLLVLDGLGWEQLRTRAVLAPTLSAGVGGPITSVVPSTTASALTSLTTGLPPAVHGIVGYRVAVGGEVMNLLGWRLGGADARQRVRAGRFQPFPAFAGWDPPVPVVTRAEYAPTGFSAAHLGGADQVGWLTASALAVEVRRCLVAGHRLVYAYYDGIDRTAHARGLGEHYDAELRAVDAMVADVVEVLPAEAVLVVVADHGQVEVGTRAEVPGPEVMEFVHLMSGEGRFRWLHVNEGATDDVAAAAREAFEDVAWVLTRDEVIEQGWLGGEPVPSVADRLGDVALVPFAPTAFVDPADTGEQRLVSRHGSLTADEMLVPLLGFVSARR